MEVKLHTKNDLQPLTRSTDDYQLVQRSIAGNQRAYSILFDRYRTAVFLDMYKRVKDPFEAEDLAVEALGKAFLKLTSFSPTHGFSTWLFRIARNNCIDYIRRKKSTIPSIGSDARNDSDYAALGISPGEALSPEELMIRRERIEMVQKTLSGLQETYRTILELRYYDELSYEEIARELNMPIGTVKAQLFRAKDLLYQQMKKPYAQAHLDSTTRYAV